MKQGVTVLHQNIYQTPPRLHFLFSITENRVNPTPPIPLMIKMFKSHHPLWVQTC